MLLTLAVSPLVEPEFEQLLRSGFRYALSLTHDRSEAEDLVHDTCVAIMRAGGKWEKGYFFAAIRNRFVDRVRRNRKILFVSLDGQAESGELNEDLLSEDLIENDVLETGLLHRALGSLRPDERETLFLAVVEGHTAHEIASMTHRPRGTVLSLLHRTKQKLRKLLTTRENAS